MYMGFTILLFVVCVCVCVCFQLARLVCVCLPAILPEIVEYFSSGGVCVIVRAFLAFELGQCCAWGKMFSR